MSENVAQQLQSSKLSDSISELEKRKSTLEKNVRFFDSFMKVLVTVIVVHGLLCVTVSYVLAFLGSPDALESLSSTLAQEIMGPVATYGLTKTIENVSKYNDWLEKYLDKKYGFSGGDNAAGADEEINAPENAQG